MKVILENAGVFFTCYFKKHCFLSIKLHIPAFSLCTNVQHFLWLSGAQPDHLQNEHS